MNDIKIFLFYLIVALSFALLRSPALAQAEISRTLDEFCADNNLCRKNTRVVLKTEGGDIDTVIPVYWPAVFADSVSMLPGCGRE